MADPQAGDSDSAGGRQPGALDLQSAPAFLDPPDLPAPSLAWGSW
jgi:hypothetical protein